MQAGRLRYFPNCGIYDNPGFRNSVGRKKHKRLDFPGEGLPEGPTLTGIPLPSTLGSAKVGKPLPCFVSWTAPPPSPYLALIAGLCRPPPSPATCASGKFTVSVFSTSHSP